MEAKLESKGGEVKHKGWNPESIKAIVIKFQGKVTSTYRYPVRSEDQIKEITIRVEEG